MGDAGACQIPANQAQRWPQGTAHIATRPVTKTGSRPTQGNPRNASSTRQVFSLPEAFLMHPVSPQMGVRGESRGDSQPDTPVPFHKNLPEMAHSTASPLNSHPEYHRNRGNLDHICKWIPTLAAFAATTSCSGPPTLGEMNGTRGRGHGVSLGRGRKAWSQRKTPP